MNISQQLDYMYSLGRYGSKPGLAVIQSLMDELGNPHRDLPAIHIAGTNGKGSTAAMLDSVLRTAGYRCALYTSPHIYRFNERIRVAGQEITDAQLAGLVEEVRDAAARRELQPTFFEFTTAIAFLHFARSDIDIAVVEVGMGGLRDATNVIMPLVSVITNIGHDHTHILGDTRTEIAKKKAGIIKQGVPVVAGEADAEIRKVLADTAIERRASFFAVDQDIELSDRGILNNMQHFDLAARKKSTQTRSAGTSLRGLAVPLLGGHQVRNAATAVLALAQLPRQLSVSEDAIRNGLAGVQWEGRADVVSRRPCVLVDGAHNPESLSALREVILNRESGMTSRDVLVCSLKKEKDVHLLTDSIVPLFQHIIATEGVYESMKATGLAAGLAHHHDSVEAIADPQKATRVAVDMAGSDGGVLVTGSLYMIPEALAYLRQKEPIGPLTP